MVLISKLICAIDTPKIAGPISLKMRRLPNARVKRKRGNTRNLAR